MFLKSKKVFACADTFFAVRTRLELATYGVTGRYSNQLNYRTILRFVWLLFKRLTLDISQKRLQKYSVFWNRQNFFAFFCIFCYSCHTLSWGLSDMFRSLPCCRSHLESEQ